ncbi:hypothetical protein HETIRDRAFT_423072 [Heterobasidion irregulare TC 32-1]|uniref:Uncharacterized protein n=1 Tax=Heterobasidion irregulare (strain TC 32-1) TaxID=747525 RepID=W4JPB1_HETIT|nr:uncharacterized protein HETIRDRAFT_423072 [Heterobasidion irregulare TC 32-1]ETW75368.1 hypothetical protein HETIRDRAFT_423072 [Heterobasidion irregulare TC 32-1]
MSLHNGILYLSGWLIIPSIPTIFKSLLSLTHDSLRHFGSNKYYTVNKSLPLKPLGPLYPLPISNAHGNSVAIKFIRPLPIDSGYNMIISMTYISSSNIHIIPTKSTLTVKEFVVLFFDHWYCENGLPFKIDQIETVFYTPPIN